MTSRYLLRPVLLALSLNCVPLAGLAQDAAKAARYHEDALKRYEQRDIAGAIIQLKNALQADKNQLPVHVLLGKALLANSQPAAAEVAFDDALRLGVNRAEVAVPLAMALLAQGRQPQMLADARLLPAGLPAGVQQALLLERALAQSDIGDARAAMTTVLEARSLDPSDATTWIAEVPLRIRARQFPEALAAADHALKLSPGSSEALYQRGATLHAMGQITLALAAYDKAVQSEPGHAESRLARAGLYVDLSRDADAAAEVQQLLKLKPRDPRGTYLLALLSDRAGNPVEAKKHLKSLTDLLDPVPIEQIRFRPQLLMLNGLAHFGLGELENARPYLEMAARQQAGNPLNKLLAQIALAEPNANRAAELLEAYVKANPGDGQALLMLASAHMSQGRHARAVQLMQDALKAKDAPEYRGALGLSLLKAGQPAMAEDQLAKAYKADPRQTQAGLALVIVHLRNNQVAKAVAVADTLVRANPANPTVLVTHAYAKTQARDYAAARASYEKALVLDPNQVEAKRGLAHVEAMTGQFDAADRRLRAALKGDERNTALLFEFALLNELRGKDDEALKWLESAAAASGPRDNRANFALVAWHLRKNQPARAVDAGKALLAKAPDDVQALLAHAGAQLANGDAAGAKTHLTNASRRAAFDAPVLERIARAQLDAQDLAGAAYSLDKALSGQPDYLPAMALMSTVELMQGDAAKAERRARQVMERYPHVGIGHGLLADVATSRRQTAAAIDALRKAHQIDKNQASLLRLFRVLSLQEGGKPAIDLALGWLKTHPKDVVVQKWLADAHARAGNFAAARRTYESVLALQPKDSEALNNLANVLIRQNDPGATTAAERALAVMPHDARVIDTAGWAYHKAGNNERALQLLRDARLRDPGNPEIRFHLAQVLAQAGRHNEAREELQVALRSSQFASAAEARALMSKLN
jgi:putative PEP-CTERM system TPR-repeat lipoprotein